MKLLQATGFFAALLLAACSSSASSAGDDMASTSADLRELQPDEIVGQIHYGDSVSIDYTGTPRYRAYWFQGTKGDWLDVNVTSSTNDVWAFVVDDHYNTVRRGTRGVLPKDGKYFIAVREGQLAPATITIDFKLTVPQPGDVPPAADD
jgi:hypothetical protein